MPIAIYLKCSYTCTRVHVVHYVYVFFLVSGILAGNVFDWGAKEVAALMETSNFGFQEAMEKLQRECFKLQCVGGVIPLGND